MTGAADGYGRMAGKPAFTLLHVGSGFANSIGILHNAGRANTTMVNVVGANATYHQPNFAEHEFINGKIVDLARVVSHWAHEAKSASDLGCSGHGGALFPDRLPGRFAPWSPPPTATGIRRWLRLCRPRRWRRP